MRGWPVATIAFYGPNLSQATKSQSASCRPRPPSHARCGAGKWSTATCGQIQPSQEILDLIESHSVLSVVMTDGIIGCPHQEGVDYEGEWCPVCEFWRGRDRFTGQRIH
jgi:hypothetical protein